MDNKDLIAIRKRIGHVPMLWHPTLWLDTKVPGLNLVLGHPTKGIPYGRVTEVFGWNSQGKSSLILSLAALTQRNGAYVILGDIENSFMADYARARGLVLCPYCKGTQVVKLKGKTTECKACSSPSIQEEPTGLDLSRLMVIKPYVGKFSEIVDTRTKRTRIVTRLTNAQELCAEIEEAIKLKVPQDRKVVVLDSVAAMLTAGEAEAGLNGGMRSNMDLPMFMGKLLRRWTGLAQVHNAWVILVNQMRTGPKSFGNPEYTPGGNAPLFYSHVRVQVQRITGSRITDKGKTVGIRGKLICRKNKTGGEEGAEIGFRLFFKGGLEFVPVKDLSD
jgi:RecA/RadA recombinase